MKTYEDYQLAYDESHLPLPYVELCRAVLLRAISDLVEKDKEIRKSAYLWIHSLEENLPFTFASICQFLELDAPGIRRECSREETLNRLKDTSFRRRVNK